MTLEQAVEVLNREKHSDWDTWFSMGGYTFGDGCTFTPFEAAEKWNKRCEPPLSSSP
jgi:hypothetical protein